MSNTFMSIKTYSNIAKFRANMSHTGRKTNLVGKYRADEFINQISDNRDILKNTNKSDNERTRTQISKEISRFKYKLGRTKKPATKLKYENKIKELEIERKIFIDKRSLGKANFLEFVFSLTDVKKNLKRDKKYGKDLNILVNKYFEEKFPNAKITLSALHLDQANPHIHISAMYPEIPGKTLTNDLNASYGDIKFHYQAMQIDFNKYVKESELTKKHDLKIGDIVKGGNKDYIKLHEYKALEARLRKRAINTVDKLLGAFKADKIDDKKIINNLTNKLKTFYLAKLTNDEFPLKANEIILTKDLEIKKLEEVILELKDGARVIIDEKNRLKDENIGLTEDLDYFENLSIKLEKKLEKGDDSIYLRIDAATRDINKRLEQSEKERIAAVAENHELKDELAELKEDEIDDLEFLQGTISSSSSKTTKKKRR